MRKTVLVVDDNADELMIYTTLLRHAGYGILAARDPDTAIALARERAPDLALVDLHLRAEKDGCDVIEALRTDARTSALPVIVHTAFADADPYHQRLRDAEVDVVLTKPFDCEVLLKRVSDVIGPVQN